MEILLSQSMEYRKRQKYAAVQIVKKLFLLSLMVKGEPNAKNPLLNFLRSFNSSVVKTQSCAEGVRGGFFVSPLIHPIKDFIL